MTSKNWIRRIIHYQEKKPYNLYTILIFALFVGGARSLEEVMLAHSYGYQDSVVNTCVFYFLMIWSYTLVLNKLTKAGWKKVINVVLIGVFLGIFPPVIDVFIYGMGNYFYRYISGIPTTGQLLFYDPAHGFPLGECLVLWSTIFFAGYYVFIKTSDRLKAIAGGLSAYAVNLNAGVIIPNIGRLVHSELSLPLLETISIVQVLCSVVFFLIINPHIVQVLRKRCLHCLPFVILAFLGAAVAEHVAPITVLIAGLVFIAGVMSLVQNDFFDVHEDTLSGRQQVFEKNDVSFFNAAYLTMVIILFGLKKNLLFLPFLLLFICSVIYSYDFYRAKRFFPGNYKIEGMWGLGSFLAGMLSRKSIVFTPELIIYCFLVFGGWSLVSTFKDYKDIPADQAVGNQTGYIMLMKAGLSLERTHWIVCGTILFCLFVPAVWLIYLNIPLFVSLAFMVCGITPFAFAFREPPGKKAVRNFLFATSLYLLLLLLIIVWCRPDTYTQILR